MDFNLIMLLFGAVLFGIATAAVAESKGRKQTDGFLLGFLLGPIGLILMLVIRPDAKQVESQQLATGGMRKCPHCAELIKSEAKVCRYCGRDVTPVVAARVAPAGAAPLRDK